MLESFFNKVASLEAPIQVFWEEIYEIFKNAFFYKTPPLAASANAKGNNKQLVLRVHRRLSTILKTSKKVYEVMFFDM